MLDELSQEQLIAMVEARRVEYEEKIGKLQGLREGQEYDR